jgi:hypothetical protein
MIADYIGFADRVVDEKQACISGVLLVLLLPATKTDLNTNIIPSDKYHDGAKCVVIRDRILKKKKRSFRKR